MSAPTRANWAVLGFLGLVWGASFMGVTLALRGFGPLTVAAGRIALGALVLATFARASGRHMPRLSAPDGAVIWLCAVTMGLFSNALPFFLLSWAQSHVASGFAGVSMAAGPLITLVLAHFLIPAEQITLRRLIGIIIGFFGVAVLIGPEALISNGSRLEGPARLACVGAAGCYSIGSIIARLCPEVDRRAFASAVLVAAAVLIVPVAIAVEGPPQGVPPLTALVALVALGLIPTALAQVLLVSLVRDAGPSFTSLVNYQVPVWSVILGTLILSEPLPASLIWALLLILAGLALSQWRSLVELWRGARPAR